MIDQLGGILRHSAGEPVGPVQQLRDETLGPPAGGAPGTALGPIDPAQIAIPAERRRVVSAVLAP